MPHIFNDEKGPVVLDIFSIESFDIVSNKLSWIYEVMKSIQCYQIQSSEAH